MQDMKFRNRSDAGAALAQALLLKKLDDAVVYALPRGGAPVGAEAARALGAPFSLILVRKLGAPGHAELAIGAIADGARPSTVVNDEIVRELGVSSQYIQDKSKEALAEINRRRALFSSALTPVSPEGKTAILVDDGLATGATMEAAIKAVRKAGARRIVVAVPVGPAELITRLAAIVDDVVCLRTPSPFFAVGAHYQEFPQLTDGDVLEILRSFQPGDREPRSQ